MRKLALHLALVALGIAIGLCIDRSRSDERTSGMTFDSGYSDCRHTPSPDGQWYQKDQEHSNRYKAGCGTFGFSVALNSAWTVGVHYVSLGRVRTDALAVAYPDDDHSKLPAGINTRRSECNPSFKSSCLYQWHSSSFTRGANFSIARRLLDVGGVRFDGKVGLYVHRLSSNSIVEPLGCRDNCAWRVQIDQSGERVTPMYGVIASWKHFYAGWEFYERIGEHTPVTANVKGRVEMKTIGLRIPF